MGGVSLVSLLLVVFIWILPIWIIANSNKTQGGEKVAWILAVVFVSWFAWVFYLLLAPLKSNREQLD